jgi:hypothetical protein
VRARTGRAALAGLAITLWTAPAGAHDGPPYPILSDARAAAYRISIWTDPDATDDGTPGGQFWVILESASGALPPATRLVVTVTPLDRPGMPRRAEAPPDEANASRFFAALPLEHEGRFQVRVDIDGPLGPAMAQAEVDATYDLRPPPIMLALYALPFLAVGALWLKLLLRRRARPAGRARIGGR